MAEESPRSVLLQAVCRTLRWMWMGVLLDVMDVDGRDGCVCVMDVDGCVVSYNC